MRGFPKTINTKQDVLNLMPEFPDETKAFLQRCLDERQCWQVDEKLADGEIGVTDETHRVREDTDEDGNITERYQEHYGFDYDCKLRRMGMTVSETESLLDWEPDDA